MGGLQWEKEEKEEFIHPLNIFHKTMENKTIQTELDEISISVKVGVVASTFFNRGIPE